MVSPLPSAVIDVVDNSRSHGVSWPAIVAGATVSAALGLILLSLGVGFGLSAVSPWNAEEVSVSTLGSAAIVWLVLMQVIASTMGGYLAGRLRTRWTRVHGDEVHFRDTAHGFIAWALAVVATAAFLASAAGHLLGTAHIATLSAPSRDATGAGTMALAADVDALFRSPGAHAETVSPATREEASRLLAGLLTRSPDEGRADEAYLVDLVAARTGLSSAQAAAQVSAAVDRARTDVDADRRLFARLSLWLFVAMLIGAFCSSLAATFGGRQRDRVVVVQEA